MRVPAVHAAKPLTLTLSRRERERGEPRVQLQGKKVIALGERDGVQGSALAECARSAGAEVVLETTYCFV